MTRIITIDIEGDVGSVASKDPSEPIADYRHYLPGNHRDPDTRIWCYTITVRENGHNISFTSACLLPQTPRHFIDKFGHDNMWKNGWHLPTNTMDNLQHKSKSPVYQNFYTSDRYEDFLQHLAYMLKKFNGEKVYYKGNLKFNDNYDYEVIKSNFEKYNIPVPTNMVNVYTTFPGIKISINTKDPQWHEGRISNNKYMNVGILHNLTDSKLLAVAIENYK